MDLHSMLNDGPPPEKKKSSHTSPPPPPPPSAGREYGSTPRASHSSVGSLPPPYRQDQPHTPIYAPPADSRPRSQPQSRGLTPLLTPHHMSAENGQQYPFPQQHQQHQQPPPTQYRPYSASTPVHGYFTHPSPGSGSHTYSQIPSHSPTPLGPPTERTQSRDRSLSVSPKTIPPGPSGPRQVSLPAATIAGSDRSLSAHVPNKEKMGMNHLLGPPISSSPSTFNHHQPNNYSETIPTTHHHSSRRSNHSASNSASNSINGSANNAASSMTSLKRSAESELSGADCKRPRQSARPKERPIWACLDSRNPRSRVPGITPNGKSRAPNGPGPGPSHTQRTDTQRPSGTPGSQPNGHNTENISQLPPWRQNPPIDNNLVRIRRVMGNTYGTWERSMKWDVTLPSIVKGVTDWLHFHLKQCEDVGYDPREGCIEIEGKIGTLEAAGTGERCKLPILSMGVVDPTYADKHLRFRSEMVDAEHQQMNKFLNSLVEQSHKEPGREKVSYTHTKETDSFRTLSDAGFNALPPAALKRHQRNRELRLRTTIEEKKGEHPKVKARIVKIKVADLHIYNPEQPYDMRISMNIECNLDRPDANILFLQPTAQNPAQPDRKKDRVSYKQLCYQVDLTRVDTDNMAPKYELELEVDANSLRSQMRRMESGETTHTFTDIVEGFLENASWLMMQPRGPRY